jgi:NTE family protein
MLVPGLFDDLTVELVDGGVHDNQGVEGLVDRGCTHWLISDGSGQMPDLPRPSTRLPAVLGRVISIYGDAEREQRLLQLLRQGGSVAFMHLQTGLPARERTPGGKVTEKDAELESTDFGVVEDVQRALAQVRTDLDSFCEVEAWSLMADAYQLTGRIVPTRAELAALGTPGKDVEWPFEVVSEQLAQPSEKYLKVLRTSKQRFLKPSRMLPAVLPLVLLVLLAAVGAAAYGLWLLLTPHGTALFIIGLAILVEAGIYASSENRFVKPVAIVLFDVVLPALLAIPLVLVSWLQLGAGRWWLSLGRAQRL